MPKPALRQQEDRRALVALERRRAKNKGRERVNNAALQAGSPMYYYCESCGEEMQLPETHTCPVPKYCDACEDLRAKGLLKKEGTKR
ncbi:MAG: hypothetical protein Q7R80_02060 [bacterium]|nr:hypothetical protein [bacterium]